MLCFPIRRLISSPSLENDNLPRNTWEPHFRESRWFTRGWTLQELIAPKTVEFFSSQLRRLGDKHSLEQLIHDITNIRAKAILGSPLDEFSVEERMSWTTKRQ